MTYYYGTTVRVMQRNFILTEDGEMIPHGEWYENTHLRREEVHKAGDEKEGD